MSNGADSMKCPSCATAKPGTQTPTSSGSESSSLANFSFSLPPSNSPATASVFGASFGFPLGPTTNTDLNLNSTLVVSDGKKNYGLSLVKAMLFTICFLFSLTYPFLSSLQLQVEISQAILPVLAALAVTQTPLTSPN
jgi:hypothetical protein